MNPKELALTMIEYEELYDKLMVLEGKIKEHVMTTEQTQQVSNVVAKYMAGRVTYDYETPAKTLPQEYIEPYIKVVEKTDWRSVCKAYNLDAPILKEPEPYVKIEVISISDRIDEALAEVIPDEIQ
jgi:hypothetical protein